MPISNRDYMRDTSPRALPIRWNPIHIIIAINVLVFVGWQLYPVTRGGGFFYEHFATSVAHLNAGKVWTLVTAAFSHASPGHLLINMLVLWSFGSYALQLFGARRFWVFYLGAAAFASLANDCLALVMPSGRDHYMVGASGAIVALCVIFAMHNPREKLLLFMVIPLPAIAVVLIAVGIDVVGLFRPIGGEDWQIGHGAHLGGAAFGFAWWWRAGRGVRASRWRTGQGRDTAVEARGVDRDELDRILGKISREGVGKLGESEREFLARASREYRRRE